MKKLVIFGIAILLVFSLTGCKSPSQVVSEKVGEKIIEGAGGGKVDLDGDKVTVKNKDGSEVVLGGNEWPSDKMAKDIPELKKGKVTYVANSDVMCMIMVEDVELNDFEDYLAKVKSSGFTKDEVNFSDGSSKSYLAGNEQGVAFQLTYMTERKEVSITVGKSENK